MLTQAATLDGFTECAASADGVDLRALHPDDVLLVRTRNSTYRIVAEHDGTVMVQGGRFFRDPTSVVFDGSGLGGSLIRAGWIGLGLRMDMRAAGRRIVTSTVLAIARRR